MGYVFGYFAVNEQSFKDKWLSAEQKRNAAIEQLDGEQQARMAEAAAAAVQTKELELRIAQVQKDYDASVADARRLQGELADARSGQTSIEASIKMMAQTQEAQQQLGETLVAELRNLRTRAVAGLQGERGLAACGRPHQGAQGRPLEGVVGGRELRHAGTLARRARPEPDPRARAVRAGPKRAGTRGLPLRSPIAEEPAARGAVRMRC